jgi:hypothetical protein
MHVNSCSDSNGYFLVVVYIWALVLVSAMFEIYRMIDVKCKRVAE